MSQLVKKEEIYLKFQTKGSFSDELVNYSVKAITEDYFEEVIEILFKYSLSDELISKNTNLSDNEIATNYLYAFWKDILVGGISLMCIKDDCNKIVAVNLLSIGVKNVESEILSDDEDYNDIKQCLWWVYKQFDVFSHYGVEKVLKSNGLCVHRDFRSLGIGTKMLEARIPLMKDLEITVTSTMFTGAASQRSAIKAGFEENYSISYHDLQKINSKYNYSDDTEKFIKILSLQLKSIN